ERSIRHLLEARPPLSSRPGGRACHQDERVVPEGDRLDLGVVEGAREPDLRFGAQHHLEDLLGVARPDGDEHLGVRGLETLEHVGEGVRADREHRGDLERAARRRSEAVDRLAGPRDGAGERLGMGPAGAADGLSGLRRRGLPELLDRGAHHHLLPLVRDLCRAASRRLRRRPIVENTGRVFRQLLQAEPYLFTGGVYDPLGAQLAERVGMKSVYLSGYSMALAQGWPDMGFLTQTEVTRIASMV